MMANKAGRRNFFKAIGLGLAGLGLGGIGLKRLVAALANAQASPLLAIACVDAMKACSSGKYTCTHQPRDSCTDQEFRCQNFTCSPGPDFVCSDYFRCPGTEGAFHCSGEDPGLEDFQFICSETFTDYNDTTEGCALGSQFFCDDFLCSGNYVKGK